MSNLTINEIAINAIKKAYTGRFGAEDKFAEHMDIAKQHMRWTDAGIAHQEQPCLWQINGHQGKP